MKDRLDNLVVTRGLAESKEQAQRLILAGLVRVGGHPATKAGHKHPDDAVIELEARPRFVSRGGDKMEGAFAAFGLDVTGKDCLDVGASTGGFTDCLLQHGAARVVALDVGRDQIHWKMRQDPRVIVIEGFNARYLKAADLPFQPQFAVVDVAFISLELILPPMAAVLLPGAELVSLIKPQFEAGRKDAPRGVVRDPALHVEVCDRISVWLSSLPGWRVQGIVESPITGPEGNIEFLIVAEKG